MTDYWYIWFEVFENGNKIGSGRWHQAYAYKQNAVRRARQMWSEDLYNPMTGTTISRKWVVSKTNPWKKPNVFEDDEVYTFDTESEAKDILWMMQQIVERYGNVTRSDFLDLLELSPAYTDTKYGWTKDTLKKARVDSHKNGYMISFPPAVDISELSELEPAPNPDEPKVSIRDNLLVTAGARAAYMDCKGDIDIPGGLEGEDELANFITTAVDTYIENGDDTPFDEYIESELTAKYGKGE